MLKLRFEMWLTRQDFFRCRLVVWRCAPNSRGDVRVVQRKAVVDRLRSALGTKVNVERRKRGGRITIEFYSDDDFERLSELLTGAKP